MQLPSGSGQKATAKISLAENSTSVTQAMIIQETAQIGSNRQQ
jgi:hypothetical protein